MRPKVVLSAVILALLILVPAIYFHFAPPSSAPQQQAVVSDQVAVAPTPAVAPVMPRHRTVGPSDGGQGVSTPTAAGSDPQEYIHNRRAELAQLGTSDDPSDLKTILTELNNKEPAIRSAALSATIQFGSKDAIPALQNEMSWTEDPQEKVDIQNAIKYLNLPSFNEFQANLASSSPQPSTDTPPPSN